LSRDRTCAAVVTNGSNFSCYGAYAVRLLRYYRTTAAQPRGSLKQITKNVGVGSFKRQLSELICWDHHKHTSKK